MIKFNFIAANVFLMKWILLGIPFLIVVSFPLHFAYDWSGNSLIVGIFAPVNESVWEHLRLTFWPMLVWWLAGYVISGKGNRISADKWFTSCAVAEVTCMLVIVSFFYTYTGAFGIESIILDIFSLFLGVVVSQFLALHVYNYSKPGQNCLIVSIAILVLLAIAFIAFTFDPPNIPIFKDASTGKYGI